MPIIKSNDDLRNNYNEISTSSHFELYSHIKEGMDDIASGNIRLFSEAIADIRKRRNR